MVESGAGVVESGAGMVGSCGCLGLFSGGMPRWQRFGRAEIW